MFDSVMESFTAPDLFRIFGGSGSVVLAAGGDPITDYVLDSLDQWRRNRSEGLDVEADAIITLPASVAFDLQTPTSRLTVAGDEWDVVAKLESDASTTVWALKRRKARIVNHIPKPSSQRRSS